jgi:hypothetical protein
MSMNTTISAVHLAIMARMQIFLHMVNITKADQERNKSTIVIKLN